MTFFPSFVFPVTTYTGSPLEEWKKGDVNSIVKEKEFERIFIFQAMAKDYRNFDQYTWKQIKKQIQKFKSCPEQYAKYLKSRNMLE